MRLNAYFQWRFSVQDELKVLPNLHTIVIPEILEALRTCGVKLYEPDNISSTSLRVKQTENTLRAIMHGSMILDQLAYQRPNDVDITTTSRTFTFIFFRGPWKA